MAALELNIELHAYIPYQGQESFWPSASKIEYKRLLSKCALIRYCSDPGHGTNKLMIRNQKMVDDCDLLLALFDGTKAGGTSSCLAYAEKKQKTIINLWSKFNR